MEAEQQARQILAEMVVPAEAVVVWPAVLSKATAEELEQMQPVGQVDQEIVEVLPMARRVLLMPEATLELRRAQGEPIVLAAVDLAVLMLLAAAEAAEAEDSAAVEEKPEAILLHLLAAAAEEAVVIW